MFEHQCPRQHGYSGSSNKSFYQGLAQIWHGILVSKRPRFSEMVVFRRGRGFFRICPYFMWGMASLVILIFVHRTVDFLSITKYFRLVSCRTTSRCGRDHHLWFSTYFFCVQSLHSYGMEVSSLDSSSVLSDRRGVISSDICHTPCFVEFWVYLHPEVVSAQTSTTQCQM